jgi:hypothetical protein
LQPVVNLQIARTYLTATDPEVANWNWQTPMGGMTKTKTGLTHHRHIVAMKDQAFDKGTHAEGRIPSFIHLFKIPHKEGALM